MRMRVAWICSADTIAASFSRAQWSSRGIGIGIVNVQPRWRHADPGSHIDRRPKMLSSLTTITGTTTRAAAMSPEAELQRPMAVAGR